MVCAIVAAGALILALTVYTFPSGGTGSHAIRMAITDALGHSAEATAAAGMASLSAGRELHPTNDTTGTRAPSAFEPSIAPAVRAWAHAAAARDPEALRAWLNAGVLTTRATERDSLNVTARRLTFHKGCPLVSTLRATYGRTLDGGLHLARLTSDCPAVPAGDSLPG
jgi:hypothetical protein